MKRRRRCAVPESQPRLRRGRVRTLVRRGERAVMYRAVMHRGGASAFVLMAVLVGMSAVAAVVTGYLLIGAGAVVLGVLAWLGYTIRVDRVVPAGPGGPGPGPAPPGGTAVREPRRPLPRSPSGAAVLPIPDEDEPLRRAVAVA